MELRKEEAAEKKGAQGAHLYRSLVSVGRVFTVLFVPHKKARHKDTLFI